MNGVSLISNGRNKKKCGCGQSKLAKTKSIFHVLEGFFNLFNFSKDDPLGLDRWCLIFIHNTHHATTPIRKFILTIEKRQNSTVVYQLPLVLDVEKAYIASMLWKVIDDSRKEIKHSMLDHHTEHQPKEEMSDTVMVFHKMTKDRYRVLLVETTSPHDEFLEIYKKRIRHYLDISESIIWKHVPANVNHLPQIYNWTPNSKLILNNIIAQNGYKNPTYWENIKSHFAWRKKKEIQNNNNSNTQRGGIHEAFNNILLGLFISHKTSSK
jgi:hypothetical protein